MNQYKQQRLDILKELYAALEAKPRFASPRGASLAQAQFTFWVTMHELKKVAGDCDVAIFYLIDKGWIKADGNHKKAGQPFGWLQATRRALGMDAPRQYQITASGMDVVEASEIQ